MKASMDLEDTRLALHFGRIFTSKTEIFKFPSAESFVAFQTASAASNGNVVDACSVEVPDPAWLLAFPHAVQIPYYSYIVSYAI